MSNMHSSPIEISIQSSKAVKPSYGGSCSSSEWETGNAPDVVPLTVLDEFYDEYMSSIHAFHPPAPSNGILEAGLARALAEYREWAGRLGADNSTGRREILLNDAGARFVEATADVALDTIMPLLPSTPVVRRLHPSGDGAEELMLVQITRFACGSLVVGHAMHHAVGDGFAICHCLLAWGQATRSVAIDPVPVHGRMSLFAPRDPPQVLFEHRGTDFKVPEDKSRSRSTDHVARNDDDDDDGGEVVTHMVRFSREFICDLKSRESAGMLSPYSTLQCLVAHLWRCMTKARGLDSGQATRQQLHIAVNGRARMSRPWVPRGYTGNAVVWAHPTTTTRELLAGPPGHACEIIRREVARVDDAYFRSLIDFVSSGAMKDEEGLVSMAGAAECLDDGEVYCLQGIPFYDLDFGGGRQFLFMPSYKPVDGLIYVLPSSPVGDGSVEVLVSLPSRVMDAFSNCCYSLAVPATTQVACRRTISVF